METTTCIHQEKIENGDQGIQHGTCSICHQVRRYDTRNPKGKAKVIRLGRVNGMIVLPGPNDIVDLSPEEAAELEAAKKAQDERPQSPSDIKVSQDDQSAAAVPPKPKKDQLLQYFNDNKEAILRDYQNLKLKEFYAKWHMSSTAWRKLKVSWRVLSKVPKSPTQLRKTIPKVSTDQLPPPDITSLAAALTRDGHLPPFPPFNDSWPFKVQEKWLEVYPELKKLELGVK